jgi:hypothetical protein
MRPLTGGKPAKKVFSSLLPKTGGFFLLVAFTAAMMGTMMGAPALVSAQDGHPVEHGASNPAMFAGELMALAASSGLVCRQSSVKSDPERAGIVAGLKFSHENLEPLRTFLARGEKQWRLAVLRLAIGPGVDPETQQPGLESDLVLRILPADAMASESTTIGAILAPIQGVSFFRVFSGEPPQGVQVLNLRHEEGKPGSFQVAAQTVSELADFLRVQAGRARFRLLSRNTVGGRDFFSLELTIASPGVTNEDDLLNMAIRLEKMGKLKEFGIAGEPYGDKFREIRLEADVEALPALSGFFFRDMRSSPRLWDFSLVGAGRLWDMHFIVKPESDLQEWSSGELTALLRYGWPSELTSGLRISGSPKKTFVELEIPSAGLTLESRTAIRKEMEGIGFLPESLSPAKVRESGEEVVLWKFAGRADGADAAVGERGKGDQKSAWEEFLTIPEILENMPEDGQTRYRLRLPYERLAELFAGLDGESGRGIVEFSLNCRHPDPAEVRLIIANRVPEDAGKRVKTFLKAITRPELFWNRSEADLSGSLILQELQFRSNGGLVLKGQTLKSGRIFSDLFPRLQRIPDFSEPFFSQGNYRDYPGGGRLMTFEVTGRGPTGR